MGEDVPPGRTVKPFSQKPEVVFKMLKELRGKHGAVAPAADEDKPALTPEARAAALKEIFGLPS